MYRHGGKGLAYPGFVLQTSGYRPYFLCVRLLINLAVVPYNNPWHGLLKLTCNASLCIFYVCHVLYILVVPVLFDKHMPWAVLMLVATMPGAVYSLHIIEVPKCVFCYCCPKFGAVQVDRVTSRVGMGWPQLVLLSTLYSSCCCQRWQYSVWYWIVTSRRRRRLQCS